MDETNKDFDIELLEAKKIENDNLQLPLNFIEVGQVQNDDIKIYIKQEVYEYIQKFSASDKSKELGGILIGDYIENLGKGHVVISGYIEAKYTDASSSTLTFTHDTWEYIHSEHAKLFPSKKIVGWQHTHPNYGIFLSNYDIFIHQNFFNIPWQLAYVVDPINKTEGFFQWKNDKVEKAGGFYIYDDIGKKIQTKIEKPKTKNKGSASKFHIFYIIMIILLAGILAATFISRNSLKADLKVSDEKYQGVVKENKDLVINVDELKKQYGNLKSDLDKIQSSKDSSQSYQSSSQGEKSGDLVFEKYTVKNGDSIYNICTSKGLSFDTWKNIIKAVNNLSDLNFINEGQTIYLPVSGK